MSYYETLSLSREEFEDLLDYFEEQTHDGRTYRHLPDYRRGLERGTALVEGTVVRGFPKIPRTLVLETGVPRQFDRDVYVEEKLDGYNVRVVRLDGDVLAFTRSGIVCPFTTAKVKTLLDLDAFFDDHPDLMLCGEMVGPENPYTTHDYPGVDSIAFRAFDVRHRETGESLPVPDRREKCEAYDFPQVPFHGSFDPDAGVDPVERVIRDLDERGREGVVMKTRDVSTQLKYTTSATNVDDLAYAFSLPFDYGQSFMFRRIVREAFQSVEWGESDEAARDRAHRLGEAILLSMRETVEEIDDGGAVGEEHTVRGDSAAIAALFDHFRDVGLQLDVQSDRREDGQRVVEFRKRTQKTNDKTRAYLDGKIVRE
ncbi:MAG: RNA ligase [Haloferacaceae archaeon]